MGKYRDNLPHRDGQVLLADSGMETTLIFDDGIDLPLFASFPLLDSEPGRTALAGYYRKHTDIARRHSTDISLDTPTWRASKDWGSQLGYDEQALREVNTKAVELLKEIRAEAETAETKIVISGCIGPRGDGYSPKEKMSSEQAESYHQAQVDTFADAGADLITVLTMTHAGEAIGLVRAAQNTDIPIVIAFTVETDAKLPDGQALADAVREVEAATNSSALFYGINCAHPDHFEQVINPTEDWVSRIGLLRANASRMSHDELDNAEELDAGNPVELGSQYTELCDRLPNLVVLGGCCGTDHRHIAEIAKACITKA